jgi:ketosteroid isomerase-like protein
MDSDRQYARHVELVRGGIEAFNDRDFDTVLSLISDEMELEPAVAAAFVGTTAYRGKDGMRRYLTDITDVIENFHFEPMCSGAVGDYVVVSNRVSGRGKASGVPVDFQMTFVFRVRSEQAVWGATFFSRDDALHAIGVTEDQLELIE